MKSTLPIIVLAALAGTSPVLAQDRPDITQPSACLAEPCCSACGPQIWFSGEYLLWWLKDSPLPAPLLTTGPAQENRTPILGLPGRPVLIGGTDLDSNVRAGGRFTVGAWFDSQQTVGAEASYLFLGSRNFRQTFSSNGQPDSPFLAIPFIDANTLAESSTRVALPGGFAGTAMLNVGSRLQGAEANGLLNFFNNGSARFDLLGGFRYLNFDEQLAFATNSPTVIGPTDIFRTLDRFDTENHFWGGQLGGKVALSFGNWFIIGVGKVALGGVHEVVAIDGQLVTNDFNNLGPPQTFPGGYLALPTSLGLQSSNRFAVLPEVDVSVGYQLGGARLFVGYSLLYLSDVARPGNQIDRVINPVQAPAVTGIPNAPLVGPARPMPLFQHSDFWAQGINFGLELRY